MKEWFLYQRGIEASTLDRFKIQIKDDGSVVFPYLRGGTEVATKTRQGILDGNRKFFFSKGVKPGLFNVDDVRSVTFLVEGETDTMRLWQELQDTMPEAGVVGLPGVETWRKEMVNDLEKSSTVYVILDNDSDYNVKARVDNCWKQIKADLRGKAKRVFLPPSSKDICEFFLYYSIDDFLALVSASKGGNYHYKPLDLTAEPRPVDWLVEGFIAQGDLVMMFGDPAARKSWIAMSLAMAIVAEEKTWAGLPLSKHGKVLYVDEENPPDEVHRRIIRLGFKPEHQDKLRYLSQQGVRLDRNPELLFEEAEAFRPTLIVLDSLTRFHTSEEKDSGAMSKLFNDGIKPLSRELGATVLVLHHPTKEDTQNAFRRVRGSGDITAVVDLGLDVRLGDSWITLFPYKIRRRLSVDILRVNLVDDVNSTKLKNIVLRF